MISVVLLIAARSADGFAEWYAVHIYPALQGSIGRLWGLLPFSAAEIFCALLPAFIIIDIFISALRARPATHILLIASILILLYSSCCGVNYYREPFVDRLQFESAEFTVDELADFCEYAVSKLCSSSEEITQSDSEYPSKAEIASMAVSAMQKLSDISETIKRSDF